METCICFIIKTVKGWGPNRRWELITFNDFYKVYQNVLRKGTKKQEVSRVLPLLKPLRKREHP